MTPTVARVLVGVASAGTIAVAWDAMPGRIHKHGPRGTLRAALDVAVLLVLFVAVLVCVDVLTGDPT